MTKCEKRWEDNEPDPLPDDDGNNDDDGSSDDGNGNDGGNGGGDGGYDGEIGPGDGNNGPGGDNSESAIDVEIAQFGIDCESFNFVKTTTDAYWQEAAMINFPFNIVFIDAATGRTGSKRITVRRAIWIGIPTKRFDGTIVPPGLAAKVTADAIEQTGHYLSQYYASQESLPMDVTIENKFVDVLNSFLNIAVAGKADFHGSRSPLVRPRVPSFRLFGHGDCY